MPLPGERLAEPRFDGQYVDQKGGIAVRFFPDQTLAIGNEHGTWSVEAGELRTASRGWDCEGALGLDSLFLLASPGGDHRVREEWVCSFSAD